MYVICTAMFGIHENIYVLEIVTYNVYVTIIYLYAYRIGWKFTTVTLFSCVCEPGY